MLTNGSQLPGSRFTRGANRLPISAQVTRFTRAKLPHACRNDAHSRVYVAVVDDPAIRARPTTHGERELVQSMPATTTGLRAGKPPIHGDNRSAVPFGLVFQLPAEFSPPSIRNRAGQLGVTNHILDAKVFYGDHIIFAHKSRGDRMDCIGALIGDLSMYASDTQSLAFSPITAFLSTGQAPLLLFQITQTSTEGFWVFDLLAITQSRKVRQPKINTNHAASNREKVYLYRSNEGDVIAAVRFSPDRHHIGTGNSRQGFSELYRPEFRKIGRTLYPFDDTHVLEPEASRNPALSESRISGVITGFHAAEEMSKSLVLISKGLHKARCGNVLDPGEARDLLNFCQTAGDVATGYRLFAPLVGFTASLKRPIPQPSRNTEPLVQQSHLSWIRVAPNLVASGHGRHVSIIHEVEITSANNLKGDV